MLNDKNWIISTIHVWDAGIYDIILIVDNLLL